MRDTVVAVVDYAGDDYAADDFAYAVDTADAVDDDDHLWSDL